jgi:hypothetical protein
MKRKLLLLTLLLALLLVNSAQAMSSAHYRLEWLVPLSGGGGGTAYSAQYTTSYTVGQTVMGDSHSTHFDLDLGFWQEFLDHFVQWLPLTLK